MAGNGAAVKVHIDNVVKKFDTRKGEMTALNGVNLDIHENEFVCVVGPSGCGKSTLLYIKLVELQDFAKSYPKELSGGMKQRVAIARAYAVNPKVLLMDEPFGALDAQTRTQLQSELLETWEKEQKTCFFITHDVEEAIVLAQRVVIMYARPGRVKEVVDIDIPYPRTQETKMSPRFLELKNHIWSQVYQEYLSVRK